MREGVSPSPAPARIVASNRAKRRSRRESRSRRRAVDGVLLLVESGMSIASAVWGASASCWVEELIEYGRVTSTALVFESSSITRASVGTSIPITSALGSPFWSSKRRCTSLACAITWSSSKPDVSDVLLEVLVTRRCSETQAPTLCAMAHKYDRLWRMSSRVMPTRAPSSRTPSS